MVEDETDRRRSGGWRNEGAEEGGDHRLEPKWSQGSSRVAAGATYGQKMSDNNDIRMDDEGDDER